MMTCLDERNSKTVLAVSASGQLFALSGVIEGSGHCTTRSNHEPGIEAEAAKRQWAKAIDAVYGVNRR